MNQEKMLVIGAGGWFGKTLLASDLIDNAQATLLIGSSRGQISISNKEFELYEWKRELVQEFEPTVVYNFAFLTREKVKSLGIDLFMKRNLALTEQFLFSVSLPTVEYAMTVSSGVARPDYLSDKAFDEEPYGHLKRIEEERFMQECDLPAKVVLRAFAVSGPFVSRPKDYAFSDLILQAHLGSMLIRAREPVFRSYVSVLDSLRLVNAIWNQRNSGVIETGGDLVEMAGLAALIREVVNPRATINRMSMLSNEPSIYASSDGSWDAACASLNFTAETLREQVQAVMAVGLPDWVSRATPPVTSRSQGLTRAGITPV